MWQVGCISPECLAEFAFAPQTADSDGDFVQGILTRDQYEVIES